MNHVAEAALDRQAQFKQAVHRCYRAAGLRLSDHHADALARIYADWAREADDDVVARLERALAASLGLAVL